MGLSVPSGLCDRSRQKNVSHISSGSELNMFAEYTMVTEERFSEFFGFTEHEVDELYKRYQENNKGNLNVSRDGIKMWYNGYHTQSGERLYNPRSVVMALSNNNLGNYWTGSGPYDEIYYYIANNVGEVRDDLALMIAGEAIQQIKDKKYALKFQGKPGEKNRYTGRVLAVGIGYNTEDKVHRCKVEVLNHE